VGLALTAVASLQVKARLETDAAKQFGFTADQITLKINERLEAYALILRGGAGLFSGSDQVSRAEWHRYVETLNAHETVPGVQGIGFSQRIAAEQLPQHIAGVRKEGFSEYVVRPPGERDTYTSIIYLEPFSGRNLRAFGFDMYSEPVRRAAMDQARDTGKPALSGKVELVQETGKEVQAGTLMYVPVYRNGALADTVEQRRSALVGWAYSPYRMTDLMTNILNDWTDHAGKVVDLHVYDGTIDALRLMFDSSPAHEPDLNSIYYSKRVVEFHGTQWLLVFDAIAASTRINYFVAWSTLFGGIAISGLLWGLMLSLITTKTTAARIADGLTEEVRSREVQLKRSEVFKRGILDAVQSEICVLDPDGVILMVNANWRQFALDNGFVPGKLPPRTQVGDNYFAACQTQHEETSGDALAAREGITAVLNGTLPSFNLEYPCDSPHMQRWFHMTVTPLELGDKRNVVVTHLDITERKLNELALIESEGRFREIFDSVNDAIFIHDAATGRIMDVNRSMCEMYGHTHAEALACGPADLSFDTPPFSTTEAIEKIQMARSQGPQEFDWLARARDGHAFWTAVSLRFAHIGSQERILAVVRDISERKKTEEYLRLSASVFKHAKEGILIATADASIVEVNDGFTEITGYARAEVLGKNPRMLGSGRHNKSFYETLWGDLESTGTWSGEIWNRRKDGTVYPESLTITAVRDANGTISQFVALFSDVTARKAMEDQVHQLAFHDPLTDLPNRRLFNDRLGQTLIGCKRNDCFGAVLFMDLDNFKPVNDLYGHAFGDMLLLEVSTRLKSCVREMDTISRFGGDEFVVLINELTSDREESLRQVRLIAEKVRHTVESPYVLRGPQQETGKVVVEHVCTASIGVALFPDGDANQDDILRQADQAMYQAKQAGRNTFRLYQA
jgi:diguanylate cyclase (GGDEF)-like protein/PAS domain S-box-containing protein